MMRSKGEQLHQGSRLPQAPLLSLYDPGAHGNPEAAEQPDPYGHGVPTHGALPASFHATNLTWPGIRSEHGRELEASMVGIQHQREYLGIRHTQEQAECGWIMRTDRHHFLQS